MLFHLEQIIMAIFSVFIQLCLTISMGIHKTPCSVQISLVDVRTVSKLVIWFLTGFFAVGMSTNEIFWVGYTI